MGDDGVYASVTEIAEAERIGKSYVSRILRLALLAPEIVDAILAGTEASLMLTGLEQPLPAKLQEQRRLLSLGAAQAVYSAVRAPMRADCPGSSILTNVVHGGRFEPAQVSPSRMSVRNFARAEG